MLAAAFSIATVSGQARSAGVFSARLSRLGLVVAVLFASVAFVPILALLVWLVVVTVTLIRERAARAPAPGSLAGQARAARPHIAPRAVDP